MIMFGLRGENEKLNCKLDRQKYNIFHTKLNSGILPAQYTTYFVKRVK